MVDPVSESPKQDGACHLSKTLRLVGLGKLILAGMTLVLAFTGYDTPRPVNLALLLIGINLLVLGGSCLAVSRSFGRAGGAGPVPPALAEALIKTNTIFGYYLVLIGLALLGVGIDLVLFLGKLLAR